MSVRRPEELGWRLRALAQRIESWGDEIDCPETDADDVRLVADIVDALRGDGVDWWVTEALETARIDWNAMHSIADALARAVKVAP